MEDETKQDEEGRSEGETAEKKEKSSRRKARPKDKKMEGEEDEETTWFEKQTESLKDAEGTTHTAEMEAEVLMKELEFLNTSCENAGLQNVECLSSNRTPRKHKKHEYISNLANSSHSSQSSGQRFSSGKKRKLSSPLTRSSPRKKRKVHWTPSKRLRFSPRKFSPRKSSPSKNVAEITDLSMLGHQSSEDEDSQDSSVLTIVAHEDDQHTPSKKRGDRNRKNNNKGLDLAEVPKEVIDLIQSGIDDILEEKAERTHLTAKHVKNIIKNVMMDENVVAMVRNTVLGSQGTETEAVYEPKLTRTRIRDLLEKQQMPIHWGPMGSGSIGVPPSETQELVLTEFPEDEEDEEYRPEADDQSEDDSCFSTPFSSDMGSPVTPSTPRSDTSSSSARKQLSFNSATPVQHNPSFKVPVLPKAVPRFLNFDKQLEKRDMIVHRTRSKFNMEDTPVELLELAFVPPDVTQDMYEAECEDEEWKNFLCEFIQPLQNASTEDEEADPEYNILEDKEDETDLAEDMRGDRAVQITKKELNELMNELFDSLDMGSHIDGEKGKKNMNFSSSYMNSLSQGLIHSLGSVADGVAGQESKPCEVWVEIALPQMDKKHYSVIQSQMMQHVQLLTQTILLCHEEPNLKNIQDQCISHLEEMKATARSNVKEGPSYMAPWNLEPALEAISALRTRTGESTEQQEGESKVQKPSYRHNKSNLHPDVVETIAESIAFPFVDLLPERMFINPVKRKNLVNKAHFLPSEDLLLAMGLQKHLGHLPEYSGTKEKGKRKREHFGDVQEALKDISENLVVIKSVQQLYTRAKNLRNRNKELYSKNPIMSFYRTGKVDFEEAHEKLLPLYVPAPVQNYPIEEFNVQWQEIMSSYKRYLEEKETKNKNTVEVKPKKLTKLSKAEKNKVQNIVIIQTSIGGAQLIIPPPSQDVKVPIVIPMNDTSVGAPPIMTTQELSLSATSASSYLNTTSKDIMPASPSKNRASSPQPTGSDQSCITGPTLSNTNMSPIIQEKKLAERPVNSPQFLQDPLTSSSRPQNERDSEKNIAGNNYSFTDTAAGENVNCHLDEGVNSNEDMDTSLPDLMEMELAPHADGTYQKGAGSEEAAGSKEKCDEDKVREKKDGKTESESGYMEVVGDKVSENVEDGNKANVKEGCDMVDTDIDSEVRNEKENQMDDLERPIGNECSPQPLNTFHDTMEKEGEASPVKFSPAHDLHMPVFTTPPKTGFPALCLTVTPLKTPLPQSPSPEKCLTTPKNSNSFWGCVPSPKAVRHPLISELSSVNEKEGNTEEMTGMNTVLTRNSNTLVSSIPVSDSQLNKQRRKDSGQSYPLPSSRLSSEASCSLYLSPSSTSKGVCIERSGIIDATGSIGISNPSLIQSVGSPRKIMSSPVKRSSVKTSPMKQVSPILRKYSPRNMRKTGGNLRKNSPILPKPMKLRSARRPLAPKPSTTPINMGRRNEIPTSVQSGKIENEENSNPNAPSRQSQQNTDDDRELVRMEDVMLEDEAPRNSRERFEEDFEEDFLEEEEEEEEEEDEDVQQREEHLAALLKASSTIAWKRAGSGGDVTGPSGERKLTKQQRQLQAHVNALSHKPDQKALDKLVAQSYLTRVSEALVEKDPQLFQEFLNLLNKFSQSTDQEPVQLYQELSPLLKDFPQLAEEFVAFLLPQQAIEIGRYSQYFVIHRMWDFLDKLQHQYSTQPQYILKIMKTLTNLQCQKGITAEEVKRIAMPLLRHTHLVEALMQCFPEEPPPPSLSMDFEEITLDEREPADNFEHITLPEEDPASSLDNCNCSCHVSPIPRPITEHCNSCRLRFIDGRVYVLCGKTLRPAKVAILEDQKVKKKDPDSAVGKEEEEEDGGKGVEKEVGRRKRKKKEEDEDKKDQDNNAGGKEDEEEEGGRGEKENVRRRRKRKDDDADKSKKEGETSSAPGEMQEKESSRRSGKSTGGSRKQIVKEVQHGVARQKEGPVSSAKIGMREWVVVNTDISASKDQGTETVGRNSQGTVCEDLKKTHWGSGDDGATAKKEGGPKLHLRLSDRLTRGETRISSGSSGMRGVSCGGKTSDSKGVSVDVFVSGGANNACESFSVSDENQSRKHKSREKGKSVQEEGSKAHQTKQLDESKMSPLLCSPPKEIHNEDAVLPPCTERGSRDGPRTFHRVKEILNEQDSVFDQRKNPLVGDIIINADSLRVEHMAQFCQKFPVRRVGHMSVPKEVRAVSSPKQDGSGLQNRRQSSELRDRFSSQNIRREHTASLHSVSQMSETSLPSSSQTLQLIGSPSCISEKQASQISTSLSSQEGDQRATSALSTSCTSSCSSSSSSSSSLSASCGSSSFALSSVTTGSMHHQHLSTPVEPQPELSSNAKCNTPFVSMSNKSISHGQDTSHNASQSTLSESSSTSLTNSNVSNSEAQIEAEPLVTTALSGWKARAWTKEEDLLILSMVQEHGYRDSLFPELTRVIHNKSAREIQIRFKELIQIMLEEEGNDDSVSGASDDSFI